MKEQSSRKPKQFPRINRLFTELTKISKGSYLKILLFSLITTFLLVSIFLRSYELLEGEKILHAASIQRQSLGSQRSYWLSVIKQYPGYRDAYFKVAVLSYQLGDKKQAKTYIDSTLSIDPNFVEARQFIEQVGL